jgi:DNA-binding protein H-NS
MSKVKLLPRKKATDKSYPAEYYDSNGDQQSWTGRGPHVEWFDSGRDRKEYPIEYAARKTGTQRFTE